MFKGLFAFLAEALGLTSWILKRRAAKADDPLEQNRKRYEQIDKDLAKEDSNAASAHADDDLAELERLRNRREAKGD